MKYTFLLIALLAIACGKSSSEKNQATADSLNNTVTQDSSTLITIMDGTKVVETPDNELDRSMPEDEGYEAEDPMTDALTVYNGEYALQSSSEAEEGSLKLTYKSGSTFTITITKMVADFCSGTIEGEFSIDEYKRGSFEYDGHPVNVSLTLSGITVEDPERQLGVNSCEYSGTYVNTEGD